MNCTQTTLELHTYMDGELALERVLALESHIESCERCRQQHAQHAAARQLLRRHATRHAAPAALKVQLRKSLAKPAAASPARGAWIRASAKWWRTIGLGAAFACSLVLTWAVTTQLQTAGLDERMPDAIVSSHVRSLMSGRAADIETADLQVVRPWLTRKLGFTVSVGDVEPYDYRLVGARVDYVRNHAAAALVYRQARHMVNVFAWPAKPGDSSHAVFSRHGYNLVKWTRNGIVYCAVSDLDEEELALFSNVLKNHAG